MTRQAIFTVLALGMTSLGFPAQAADPVAGQKHYATTCFACHGANGISVVPVYPNLAGQKDEYVVAQLKAYRDGTRVNAIMAPMATSLSDTDIVNIAAFLAQLKP